MRSYVRAASFALIASTAAAATLRAQGPTPAQPAAVKFAYLDSRAILQSAPGRTEAAQQFEKEMGSLQQQMQSMADSLRNMETSYEKARPTLSPTAREGREKTLATRRQEFENRAQQLQGQAQQRQVELMQPIMDRINKVIDEIRTEEGYAIIFDVGAQGSPIVSADKSLDITDRVLARLKTTASAAPAPKPGAAPAANPGATPARPAAGPVQSPAGVGRPNPQ
jgi:outer membrane protein